LISSVDPFHDLPLEVCGYPDVNEASSVLQIVKCSSTIAAPASAGTGNWDCHIHQFPWILESTGGAVYGSYTPGWMQLDNPGGNSAQPPAKTNNWNGLVTDCVPSGTATFNSLNETSINNPFTTQLTPYCGGLYRVIAMGFEVVNTTSDLNAQGIVTVYRQPQGIDTSSGTCTATFQTTFNSAQLGGFGTSSLIKSSNPPSNTTAAMLLQGTRQWKAKDGCYVVPTLSSMDLPTGSTPAWIIFPNGGSGTQTHTMLNFNQVTIQGAAGQLMNFQAGEASMTRFNHSGAYFTGLSNATTLTLNAVYVIEKFPDPTDSLVVLAKPSCRYDPIAIQLYSEVIRGMPTGVPQRMNGLGEWFANAVSAASDFLSPALSAIPLPFTQIAGKALAAAGGGAKNYLARKKQEEDSAQVPPGRIYSPAGTTSLVKYVPKKKVVTKKKMVGTKPKKVPKK